MASENALREAVFFQPGDMVVWAEPVFKLFKRKFGEGPFQVKSVESVPLRECSTAVACKNISGHVQECNLNRFRATGHPQFVTVITLRGDMRFSGAWFDLKQRQATSRFKWYQVV